MTTDFQQIFESFRRYKILIIGDVMVDSYIWGSVSRISPEAPVPIVNVTKRERRLGGAANVALNVKALGATPILCSVIGQDEESNFLTALLQQENLSTEGLISSPERITTIKHRILSGSQHMLRIDSEMTNPIAPSEADALLNRVADLLPQADAIIFEDYDKGVLEQPTIQALIDMASRAGIPTIVDPKKKNFMSYAGCTLFKPNLKELQEGLGLSFPRQDVEALRKATRLLKEKMNVQSAMITLSEDGVFITNYQEEHHLPAHKREIADVSGAGDTVISTAALCLVAGLPLKLIGGISNLSGGLVCEYLGVAPVPTARLLSETERVFGKNTSC